MLKLKKLVCTTVLLFCTGCSLYKPVGVRNTWPLLPLSPTPALLADPKTLEQPFNAREQALANITAADRKTMKTYNEAAAKHNAEVKKELGLETPVK